MQHPLRWIETAHEHGYDVLLDAAAYLPSNQLDLSVVKPDFVPVSWYKVFGYPTGVGCLIARREALGRLRRPWFAGGSVHMATVQGDWHTPAANEACFEDGTLSFLQIPDLESGLSWVNGIGMDLIHERVMCLTGWLIGRLAALRHGNGEPMARIYGPASTRARGGTVAFNLLDPGGRVVDERAVARATAAAGISIRTGCFCNPGAGEGAFRLTQADWRQGGTGAGPHAGSVPGPPRPAERRGDPRIRGPGIERRRRGAVPRLRGADLHGSRGRHGRPRPPAGLLSAVADGGVA